jgi:hypothetical protein
MPRPHVDVINAELALSELLRARIAAPADSLNIVRHLHQTIGNRGTWPDSVEHAQSEAWFAVGVLRQIMENKGRPADELWDKAIVLTRHWRELLI